MHFDTTFQTNDQLALIHEFFPDYDGVKHTLPSSFANRSDIQIVLSGMNTEDPENYFTMTHSSPPGVLHVNLTKEESTASLSVHKPHKHEYFELMFVLDGSIYINIENSRHLYTKGCCYILNKNVIHAEEYNSDFRLVFLQLSVSFMKSIYGDLCLNFFDIEKNLPKSTLMEFLETNLGIYEDMDKDYVDFIPNREHDFLSNHVHSIFDRLTKTMLSPQAGSSIYLKNKIIELLSFLSVPANFSTTPVRIGSDAEYLLYTQIVAVMAETNGRISRNELAGKLNYSGTYLNEIAKKYSGLSLFDFGMTFCMKEAARLLTSTKENVTDIGLNLGFTNKTHFYKIFKKIYNMTPAEYRRSHK